MSNSAIEATILCGVPLVQYAGVTAAIAEGFPLHEILEIEGLSNKAWAEAKLAWKGRLVKDSMSSGDLFEAYTREIAAAEDRLSRKVAPLDADAAAWVLFLKLYSAQAAPFDWLERLGLGLNDVSRLERAWSRRIDESTALQKQVAELRKKPVGELPKLQIEPSALSRSPGASAAKPAAPKKSAPAAKSPDPRGAPAAKSPDPRDALPSKASEAGARMSRSAHPDETPGRHAPSTSKVDDSLSLPSSDPAANKPVEAVPSYLRAPKPIPAVFAGTMEVVLPAGQTLPFVEGTGDIDRAVEKARAHAEAVQGPARTPDLASGETLDLGALMAARTALAAKTPDAPETPETPGAPSAPSAPKTPPARPEAPAERASPSEPDAASEPVAPAPAPSKADPPKKASLSLEELLAGATMTLQDLPNVAEALPFAPSASQPSESPPAAANLANTPFANAPVATAPSNMPVANVPVATAPPNAPVATAPPNAPVATAPANAPVAPPPPSMPVPSVPVAPPPPSMPVPNAAPRARVAVPEYTVQQYASLWVELSLDPEHTAQTLARYRLTPELRTALDAHWGARLAADPALRAAFDQAALTYRDILLRSRRH